MSLEPFWIGMEKKEGKLNILEHFDLKNGQIFVFYLKNISLTNATDVNCTAPPSYFYSFKRSEEGQIDFVGRFLSTLPIILLEEVDRIIYQSVRLIKSVKSSWSAYNIDTSGSFPIGLLNTLTKAYILNDKHRPFILRRKGLIAVSYTDSPFQLMSLLSKTVGVLEFYYAAPTSCYGSNILLKMKRSNCLEEFKIVGKSELCPGSFEKFMDKMVQNYQKGNIEDWGRLDF